VSKGEAHSRAGVCAGRLHAVELCEHTAENLRYLIFLRILTKRVYGLFDLICARRRQSAKLQIKLWLVLTKKGICDNRSF
jgi:hypothetical protein